MASYKKQVEDLNTRNTNLRLANNGLRERAQEVMAENINKGIEIGELREEIGLIKEDFDKDQSELDFVNNMLDRLAENYLDKPLPKSYVSRHGLVYYYSPAERLGMFIASAQIG